MPRSTPGKNKINESHNTCSEYTIRKTIHHSVFFVGLARILFLAARLVYGLQGSDSLSFLLAVFFLFYVPGNLLLKYSGVENNITGSWLFLSLGTVSVPLIYLFLCRYEPPDLENPDPFHPPVEGCLFRLAGKQILESGGDLSNSV